MSVFQGANPFVEQASLIGVGCQICGCAYRLLLDIMVEQTRVRNQVLDLRIPDLRQDFAKRDPRRAPISKTRGKLTAWPFDCHLDSFRSWV